ncbi:MAG: exodeoxyribonuclease-1 [Candidatus Azotimanducaceae bacterium]|jgi:exodeoxyribonuclease-1
MQESIYWYDFETTGINAASDRPIQFAGVRTNLDLEVISEPLNLFTLPSNDIVPNPEAILVTGIDFDHLQKEGSSEVDFCREIHREFSVPGSCVTGYNSIRFDDEFSRYLFYRNFFDPYAREWQHGSSRWDVIDLFRMAYALRPDGFEWPVDETGLVSFRLEKLTEANGIGHASAHDAVSDVLATIDVTKKLRDAQPKLYEYMFALRKKNEVFKQLYPLGKNPVVHVSSMYPARQSCLSVILPICAHPSNNNGVICFDLSRDPQPLIDLSSQEIQKRLFTRQEDLGAGIERIALKTIHVNKCPALAPLSTLKGQEDRLGVDMALCRSHQKRLQKASGLVEKIHEAFLMSQFDESHDPDLMLYQGGFFSDTDRAIMDEIRQSKPESLSVYGAQFQDPRLPEMLFRYRARNFAHCLNDKEQDLWDQYRSKKLLGENGITSRIEQIQALRNDGRTDDCLDGLDRYLNLMRDGLPGRK